MPPGFFSQIGRGGARQFGPFYSFLRANQKWRSLATNESKEGFHCLLSSGEKKKDNLLPFLSKQQLNIGRFLGNARFQEKLKRKRAFCARAHFKQNVHFDPGGLKVTVNMKGTVLYNAFSF